MKNKEYIALKILITISIATIIVISGAFKAKQVIQEHRNDTIRIQNEKTKKIAIENIKTKNEDKPNNKNESNDKDDENVEVTKNGYIPVDFICQAPLQTSKNWELHEESCEEAALLMAYNYETKKTMTKDEANQEILTMIEWEKENLGGHHDLYADDFKDFAMKFYNLKEDQIKIMKNATIKDIKKEISNGKPVIVPITGEVLKNPYYPYPGYHMLLVKGYTQDKIITNDNGTRRGEDYSYNTDTFENAMKDAGQTIIIININN